MAIENNIWKLAEMHISGEMTEVERIALEMRLQNDPIFAAELQECINMLRSLNGSARQKRFRSMLHDIHHEQGRAAATKEPRTISLRTHYRRIAAVAAGIMLLASTGTFWAVNTTTSKSVSQYTKLRKEVDNLKRSQIEQGAIIKDIKSTTEKAANTPAIEARISGTGFAITNDGYFVTNYHVTEGADSIYIKDNTGKYYKAYLVNYDAQTDIALLKVENKSFRFGKGEIPYSFAPKKAALGSYIYTLGYPGEDIAYNEGYISSRNGYQGDSLQYRLELPSRQGQSGAPVIDNKGNLIAIVSGKETQSKGTTYAVSSMALLKLLQDVPREVRMNLPKANKLSRLSREEQIEKMQSYTFSVKVYK
ncbi:MAG: trypsin-like peptidase domain-containing protein [Flavipsychrobacter sp.]|nr:trypsin-like peptidase domain-containing protein [Flavipsychrobacter sp.]